MQRDEHDAPDGDQQDDGEDERSFFAEQLAEHISPYLLPPVDVEYEDDEGPYIARLTVELDVPDDLQVAALDRCAGALDELAVLVDDEDVLDDLLDAIDALGWSIPATADAVLEHWHLERTPARGWTHLVEQINVYGEAIEYDLLAELGLDLAEYFRGSRPWDHLQRLVERLPVGSHYRAALADDDTLAADIAEVHGPPSKRPKSTRPALTGWTTEVSYLHQIANLLGRVQWSVFAAQAEKSKRGSPPKGQKGPETADERYERRDFAREHAEVAGQILVRRGGSAARGGQAWVPGAPTPGERTPAPEAVRGAVHLDAPTHSE